MKQWSQRKNNKLLLLAKEQYGNDVTEDNIDIFCLIFFDNLKDHGIIQVN